MSFWCRFCGASWRVEAIKQFSKLFRLRDGVTGMRSGFKMIPDPHLFTHQRKHSTKNVLKLDNYYNPSRLKQRIKQFVHYYNFKRYHESISNLTPADVYYGRSED